MEVFYIIAQLNHLGEGVVPLHMYLQTHTHTHGPKFVYSSWYHCGDR